MIASGSEQAPQHPYAERKNHRLTHRCMAGHTIRPGHFPDGNPGSTLSANQQSRAKQRPRALVALGAEHTLSNTYQLLARMSATCLLEKRKR